MLEFNAKTTVVVSVIITAHNEGDEVRRTVDSIFSNTFVPFELLVVDDASTDGCCDDLNSERVKVICHPQRLGVATSRNQATRLAVGDVFVFMDGHQRVSHQCIDQLAAVAIRRMAIVWPDVRALHDLTPIAHGASFCLSNRNGYFSAAWNTRPPRSSITKITSLRAPGYAIPRNLYEQVRWPSALRGWGGSEAAISLKAFFADVPILHVCGPLARHLFKRQFQYQVSDESVWRNQAIIARVCFDDRTWLEYWYPKVFSGHLSSAVEKELISSELEAENRNFAAIKKQGDTQFWTDLLQQSVPTELTRTTHAVTD